jgi:hypothetical protein
MVKYHGQNLTGIYPTQISSKVSRTNCCQKWYTKSTKHFRPKNHEPIRKTLEMKTELLTLPTPEPPTKASAPPINKSTVVATPVPMAQRYGNAYKQVWAKMAKWKQLAITDANKNGITNRFVTDFISEVTREAEKQQWNNMGKSWKENPQKWQKRDKRFQKKLKKHGDKSPKFHEMPDDSDSAYLPSLDRLEYHESFVWQIINLC